MLSRLITAVAAFGIMTAGALAADLGGKVIKIGTDATYPPMETVDEATGNIVGFDVDLVNAICESARCAGRTWTTCSPTAARRCSSSTGRAAVPVKLSSGRPAAKGGRS